MADAKPTLALLTVEQTAERLNVCKRTVYRRIKDRELPFVRTGRLLRIDPVDLERYIAVNRHSEAR
ncbi:MAG: helix-turn-helix domain-containing protein [Alphaproteobacteria bacterium]|uniref:helix-turn-helix domain-containing protein n=1 Tax=Marinobacter salarius TaxID=1420917 RepID=UPI0032EE96E3